MRRALLLLAATVALAAPHALALPLDADAPERPLVIAHRGGAAEAPENTMVAFERALALGVDVLEMDLQWTKDLVPVVLHDADLARTTDCEGPANARTLAELSACNACAAFCHQHAFVPIPTFAEVLARFEHEPIAINAEIKNVPTDPATFDPLDAVLLPRVADMIRAHPAYLPDRILVSSFNFKTTTHLETIAPEIPVALLTINPADAHAELAFAKATGLDALQPTQDGMRPENAARLAADARALGLRLDVWTVDDPERMRLYADAGVDGIITNRPTLLLDVLTG